MTVSHKRPQVMLCIKLCDMTKCNTESRPHCAGNFGFEGACQCTFTEGGFFGGSLNTNVGPAGSPQENGFVEGQLMTFRVERRE